MDLDLDLQKASVPGIRIKPTRPGLPVSPGQNCGEHDKDRDDDNGHQQRVSRHHPLPDLSPALFCGHGRRH
ncbi:MULTISPECIES: hypothetical protein [Bradyrhizobium]|uniref:hypothetical protein n=1 Tax=Bradyrhizobium TaxID=374 RepID=UPI0012FD3E36|nr:MULTISPECIES: hypothetical protein [Bradyrhizobium]MCA1382827.1 hypothetical protein [Bradyrhizobium sp. BRP05]MCA1421933.1 hypothetical protein [Bradyrhizobium sp. BRP23]